jgi:hypothetical protein
VRRPAARQRITHRTIMPMVADTAMTIEIIDVQNNGLSIRRSTLLTKIVDERA